MATTISKEKYLDSYGMDSTETDEHNSTVDR